MAHTILTAPAAHAVPPRPWYLVAATAAFAIMTAAILSSSLWFLNFVHVMAGALWTEIDLFMGFIIGPVMRHVSFETRRAVIGALVPRTLILMPTLSAITSTAGWFLAVRMLSRPRLSRILVGHRFARYCHRAHGAGAGLSAADQLYFEVQKSEPDTQKIARWMRTYLRVVAVQGTMQVAIIVVMARFATGF